MMRSDGVRWLAALLLAASAAGCGKVRDPGSSSDEDSVVDASPDVRAPDDPSPGDGDAPAPVLGTQDNPARTCAELRVAGMPSGAYWLRSLSAGGPPFRVYCEQQLTGGGWAMVENSVRRDDGTTALFWQFKYADRLNQLGTPAPDQNYYDGSLYLVGTEYMDVFVDLQGTTALAALMTAAGFEPRTMRFTTPKLISGNVDVFTSQFATGWSAQDYDGDASSPNAADNCALIYGAVAQHYSNCWAYNLGVDADKPIVDGNVGPHVHNDVLTSLNLVPQTGAGNYSQVKRIARFTRW